MPAEQFTGALPEDVPPLTVQWNEGCTHGPGDTCFCLLISTVAYLPMPLHADDPAAAEPLAVGYSLPMDAASTGALIRALLRARREAFGAESDH